MKSDYERVKDALSDKRQRIIDIAQEAGMPVTLTSIVMSQLIQDGVADFNKLDGESKLRFFLKE